MTVKVVTKSEAGSLANSLGVSSIVTGIDKTPVSKEDASLVTSSSLYPEDEFHSHYLKPPSESVVILPPPFPPSLLAKKVDENNALGQLVSSMEVNVDGTGYVLEPKNAVEGGEESEESLQSAKGVNDFFQEIYPETSFLTVRRGLRRDQESTGNAYLEVLRTVGREIMFANRLDATGMRLVKLDEPVAVTKKVYRMGEERTITMQRRERRYVQIVGGKLLYFKEFNASRDLNKHTGEWAKEGEQLDASIRATEVIHFTVHKAVGSPYGVPRWINQLPSILGSRKAEELNLEFFDSGGLPPALVVVQGGEMTAPVKKALTSYLSGGAASKQRAAILEVLSTSGDLSSSGNVQVKVERFGAERQNDSMFEKYDERSEARVRSSFRIPPIFVGKSEDYSFATAYASYTVAEAQVFNPERTEFDEIINNTLVKEIAPDYVFRSLPLSVQDIDAQIKGIEISKEFMEGEQVVGAINETLSMNLRASDQSREDKEEDKEEEGEEEEAPEPTAKADPASVFQMANDWVDYSINGNEKIDIGAINALLKRFSKRDRDIFDGYVAMRITPELQHDVEGALELASATIDALCCEGHGS